MIKFSLYLFLLLIVSSCGLDNKNIKKENDNFQIIFEKSKPIKKELNSDLIINLSKIIKGEPFLENKTKITNVQSKGQITIN